MQMFYMCAFNEKYLNCAIDIDVNKRDLTRALQNFDDGEASQGHSICERLKPNSTLAILISALFSKERESESQFQIRHFSDLECAAELGNSLAQFSLAVYYETGDLVEADQNKAEEYYRLSSESKLPLACHIYGIMLYYGTEYTEMRRDKGLELVNYAANQHVDDATIFLNFLEK
jgi:hypothetical protein